jgi:hypothetical protein
MKRIALAGAIFVAFAFAVSAQQSTTPKKTGYQIPGCTYYVLQISGKVVQVCDRRDARKPGRFWSLADLESNSSGSSGGSGSF